MEIKTREQFLIHLMKFCGIFYRWGGSNPKTGLDCSGFVQLAYEPLGLDPVGDQSAHGLFRIFTRDSNFLSEGIYLEMADVGDLLFFGTKERLTHVAIALGHELMIEAGGGGSECTTEEIARRLDAKVRVTSVYRRSDFMHALRPIGLPWYNG